jgi:hypothetical protein
LKYSVLLKLLFTRCSNLCSKFIGNIVLVNSEPLNFNKTVKSCRDASTSILGQAGSVPERAVAPLPNQFDGAPPDMPSSAPRPLDAKGAHVSCLLAAGSTSPPTNSCAGTGGVK